jgi:hypothetical protein
MESGQYEQELNLIKEQTRSSAVREQSNQRGGSRSLEDQINDTHTGSSNEHTGLPENDDEILRQLSRLTNDFINEDRAANLYLMQQKEKVEQVECGSIHTLVRTNLSRLFSCGNGATFALGHGNKETCKNFKQI